MMIDIYDINAKAVIIRSHDQIDIITQNIEKRQFVSHRVSYGKKSLFVELLNVVKNIDDESPYEVTVRNHDIILLRVRETPKNIMFMLSVSLYLSGENSM